MTSPAAPASQKRPVVLTIAGSDNSAGAGLQADLKAASALGTYALTAVTCVVAEVPGKVTAIHPIPPPLVAEQIRLCFDAFPVAAVKTGMLHSAATIAAVADALAGRRVPLVVDPVMIATSGHALLEPDAVELYRTRLFPLASVVTPNLDETSALLARPVTSLDEMQRAGEELAARHGGAWLIKGGHLRTAEATDLLIADGTVTRFSAPFVPGISTHGTGCTYSAAIAAGLAKQLPLIEATRAAKTLVTRAITGALRWPGGVDALDHFAAP